MSSSAGAEKTINDMHSEEKSASPYQPPRVRTATCLSLTRWKTFFLLFSTVLSILLLWMATSNLFDLPRDVKKDRQMYSVARRQYLDNPHYWYSQYLQLEHSVRTAIHENREHDVFGILQQATPQTIIAFLVNHGDFKMERLKTVAIVPKISGSSFVLAASKPEPDIWPFKVMLSVELHVSVTVDGTSILVSRLRRGSQELSPSLSWAYFGPELERLKALPSASIRTRQDFTPKHSPK